MNAPAIDADLYAEEVLIDSRDLFARIRDAGPVVWLSRHKMYAIGRFEHVRVRSVPRQRRPYPQLR